MKRAHPKPRARPKPTPSPKERERLGYVTETRETYQTPDVKEGY